MYTIQPKFFSKIEAVLFNAVLKITNAVQVTSREKLYRKLETEPLSFHYWFRRRRGFCKIKTQDVPKYPYN